MRGKRKSQIRNPKQIPKSEIRIAMTVRLCICREKMVGNVSDVSAALQGVNDSDTPINLGSDYNFDGERTSLAANIGGSPNFDTTEGSEAFTDFTSGTDDFVNNYGYDALSDMTSISQIAELRPRARRPTRSRPRS